MNEMESDFEDKKPYNLTFKITIPRKYLVWNIMNREMGKKKKTLGINW